MTQAAAHVERANPKATRFHRKLISSPKLSLFIAAYHVMNTKKNMAVRKLPRFESPRHNSRARRALRLFPSFVGDESFTVPRESASASMYRRRPSA